MWRQHVDWMALAGINRFYAVTGQEEIQYKVSHSQLSPAQSPPHRKLRIPCRCRTDLSEVQPERY